jgi:hypothetical protein
VSTWYGRRDETCPVSTGGGGGVIGAARTAAYAPEQLMQREVLLEQVACISCVRLPDQPALSLSGVAAAPRKHRATPCSHCAK